MYVLFINIHRMQELQKKKSWQKVVAHWQLASRQHSKAKDPTDWRILSQLFRTSVEDEMCVFAIGMKGSGKDPLSVILCTVIFFQNKRIPLWLYNQKQIGITYQICNRQVVDRYLIGNRQVVDRQLIGTRQVLT